MRPGGTVTFDYEYETPPSQGEGMEYDVVELVVEATLADWHPEVHPDLHQPGCPSEGGQIEDLTVRWPDGKIWTDPPAELIELLETRAYEIHEEEWT